MPKDHQNTHQFGNCHKYACILFFSCRLQETLKKNPHVVSQLREELQQLLNTKLQELGIDPKAQGIPKKLFKRKMSQVAGQETALAKVSQYNI